MTDITSSGKTHRLRQVNAEKATATGQAAAQLLLAEEFPALAHDN